MKNKNNRLLPYLVIVFFSGFSFLIYEVSWFRMLALLLGATVSASTIVLMAFMAGFGAGAFFWGKKSVTNSKLLSLLIIQMLVVGAFGIINYFLFSHLLPQLYPGLQQAGLTSSVTSALVYIIALLLLFIPAFFMGGILPVASTIIINANAEIASMMGRIYAYETMGSTLGGLITGFVLIGFLGQQSTVFIAVIINLMLAAFLFIMKLPPAIHDNDPLQQPDQKTHAKPLKKPGKTEVIAESRFIPLLATFAFGFTVIGLQVIWFRIFRIYMTNTSYTFSLIASMVILGLFAGSWFYSKKSNSSTNNSWLLIKLMIYTVLAVLAGFLIMVNLPELILFPIAGKQEAYFLRIIVIPVISALLVIIPVTFLSGYAFPLACTMHAQNYREIGSSIGSILLSNTAGSIAGPLLAAYLAIPVWGAGLSIIFFILFLLVMVFLMLRKATSVKAKGLLNITIPVAAVIIFIILIINPQIYILPPSFSRYEKEILAYKETVEGTYVVGKETSGNNTVLSTYVNNSAVIGSSYDAIKVVKMVGHLPFYSGLQCKNALVVGFGIGVTTSAIASHPEVESIDCIELVAGLKDAAHYYQGLNNNIQNDKRLKVKTGDGRHFLQSTDKKYDLISSDPTHPILGSGNLYTKEYFELCKAHLNQGGMVSQYMPLHKLLPADFLGIIKTFHSVFPNSTIWLGHYHAILLGCNGPLKIDFEQWSDNISQSVTDPYFYNNPYHVAACMVLDSAQIEKFPAGTKINTDNQPYAEFFKLSSFDAINLTANLDYLNKNRCSLNRVFYNIPDQPLMDKFIKGNQLATEGFYQDLSGNRKGFLQGLQAAAVANPEDEEYPFLIRFNFGR
ncbi:MAG: fused MFS/spermidine synthase [Lentimicrobiaceae bacterium]|nr:fused MFS/spermidine synthase [Lentimicrobiaceae bacterium]